MPRYEDDYRKEERIIHPDPSDIDADLENPDIDDQDASGAFENDKNIRNELYDQIDNFEARMDN